MRFATPALQRRATTFSIPFRPSPTVLAVLAAVAVILGSLAMGTPAKALSGTPYQCDSVPKYYCSTVQYDLGSPATNVDRLYEGKISCGSGCTIVAWELWWMQDWVCSGSCTWIRNYGEQAWQTNTAWQWWHINASGTMTQDALVNMKLRYHEKDPITGADTYWCSPQLDHYIWSGTSATIGSGGC
jgi:hypothetical protein